MSAQGNFPELTAYLADPAGFRTGRRFRLWARECLRLSESGREGPEALRPEAWWRALLAATPDPEAALAALSQATGLYFFPSREWPGRLLRFLRRLKVRRLLEAGAGRGYLSQALAPLARDAGVKYLAVDRGDGEFVGELPGSPLVQPGDAFQVVKRFAPQAVFYAWPPPGQSLLPLFEAPQVRWVMVAGVAGGGLTGNREDWTLLPHRKSAFLSRFCRGRAGQARHQVTIFWQGLPDTDQAGRGACAIPFPAVKEAAMEDERFPVIVEEECIACGACVEICPEVFLLNESLGFAQVVNPGGGEADKIQEAIDACPVHCIHWSDE